MTIKCTNKILEEKLKECYSENLLEFWKKYKPTGEIKFKYCSNWLWFNWIRINW